MVQVCRIFQLRILSLSDCVHILRVSPSILQYFFFTACDSHHIGTFITPDRSASRIRLRIIQSSCCADASKRWRQPNSTTRPTKHWKIRTRTAIYRLEIDYIKQETDTRYMKTRQRWVEVQSTSFGIQIRDLSELTDGRKRH